MAADFTALGDNVRPRPLGLSGWVSTRPQAKSDACSRCKMVAANSGLPANAILQGCWKDLANGFGPIPQFLADSAAF